MDAKTIVEMLEGLLVPTMGSIPITLNIVGYILKKIPQMSDWLIPIILWALGIVFGFAYQTWDSAIAPSVAGAIVQGTLSCGLAIMYHQVYKQVLAKGKEQA